MLIPAPLPPNQVSLSSNISSPETGGFFGLFFTTESGLLYTVQYKNSLSDLVWTDLETVFGTGGVAAITDADIAVNPTRFYRVILEP